MQQGSYAGQIHEGQVSFSAPLFQLEFSDDIVKIIQTAFNSDGGQLESRKANSMLKSFFIRVRKSWWTRNSDNGTSCSPTLLFLMALSLLFVTANGADFSMVQGEGVQILGDMQSLF